MSKTLFMGFFLAAALTLSGFSWGDTKPKDFAVERDQFKFSCVTAIPSTSFIGESQDGVFRLTVIHHNGVKYMPIFEGLITPNDLGLLAEEAKLFTNLGEVIEATFPMSECKFFAGVNFSCTHGSTITKHGVEYKAWQVSLGTIDSTYEDYTFHQLEAFLSFDVDNRLHHLPMRYDPAECLFE